MKQLYMGSILLFAVLLLPFATYSQKSNDKDQEQHLAHYIEGKITIKLKEGVGDYQKQLGSVLFGIPSLDEKVERFGIYEMQKQFKFNKRIAKPGLPDLSRIYQLSYSSESSLRELVRAFSSDPNVEYAEGVPYLRPDVIPNDSLYDDCQHLPQIMAEEAWDIHKGEDGSEEIVIAIVDEGVEWTHEDLVANTYQNLAEDADGDSVTIEFIDGEWVLDPDDINGIDEDGNGFIDDLAGWNFINENGDPAPTANNNQHGTHCAGIACATSNNDIGVASVSYNLKHMGVCMSAGGDGGPYAFDAIIYAAEMGADIISFSWGGWPYSEAHQEAVLYSQGLGSIIVVSAGNTGVNVFNYPASYLGVISVANVYESDAINPGSTHNYAVDISAPGTGILSTVYGDEYEAWTGTSMACPMISGSLGLLKSYHPDWSNGDLITRVFATSDNIDDGNTGYEHLIGSGRVNAYEMLLGENIADPYLKLDMISLNPIDENENSLIEAGESAVVNMDIRNFMQTYSADNATMTLTTTSSFVSIVDGDGSMDIGADSIMSIIDQFQIQVSEDAQVQLAEFNLHIDADIEIAVGEDIAFSLLIAPSGYFVYDGIEEGDDFSGLYIYDYLIENEYEAIYGVASDFPAGLTGFDGVFLCYGNYNSGYRQFSDDMVETLIEFMENGGDVYLEGGDPLGFDQSGNSDLFEYFGIESTNDGGTNDINSLMGQEEAITDGIEFMGNTQVSNSWIDTFVPNDLGVIAFEEDGYGTVAIQYDADDYQSFVFSYALAKLIDEDSPSTRDELIQEILYFFDGTTSLDELDSNPFQCVVYPNPSNAGSSIRYYLPNNTEISIEIMNAQGQIVERQLNQFYAEGQHEFYWNAEEMPAGVYYYTLGSASHKSTGKIILMR